MNFLMLRSFRKCWGPVGFKLKLLTRNFQVESFNCRTLDGVLGHEHHQRMFSIGDLDIDSQLMMCARLKHGEDTSPKNGIRSSHVSYDFNEDLSYKFSGKLKQKNFV